MCSIHFQFKNTLLIQLKGAAEWSDSLRSLWRYWFRLEWSLLSCRRLKKKPKWLKTLFISAAPHVEAVQHFQRKLHLLQHSRDVPGQLVQFWGVGVSHAPTDDCRYQYGDTEGPPTLPEEKVCSVLYCTAISLLHFQPSMCRWTPWL